MRINVGNQTESSRRRLRSATKTATKTTAAPATDEDEDEDEDDEDDDEDPLPKALGKMASVISDANKKAQLERDSVMNKIASGLNHAVDPSQILARCGMNE